MIRRVVLSGWKAFDLLEFEPGPGVTFVTARNGIGKSSLLQGLGWSVFGERSGVDAELMRRIGHSQTATLVELDLPDGQVLTIEREVGADPVARIGRSSVPDIDEALRSIMGANLDFVARAVTLSQQTLAEQASSFEHLEAHLAEVFGISSLRAAADQVAAEFSRVKTANARLRAANKPSADTTALRARADVLRNEIGGLVSEIATVEPDVAAARSAFDLAQQQVTRATAHSAWLAARAEVQTRVEERAEVGDEELAVVLAAAVGQVEQQISNVTMDLGASTARIASARESLVALEVAGALCPTCQRPMSDHERADAQTTHTDVLALNELAVSGVNEQLARLRAELLGLNGLVEDVRRLGPEPEPAPAVEPDVVGTGETLTFVQARLFELQQAATERRGALAEIEKTIVTQAANEAADAERVRAIRREAVAQLTAETMHRTVARLMEEWVDPVATEISGRWKQVFGDRGTLRLTPKGEITMERDGHLIPFPQFSPGEQVVSMLALRFLTVSASTTSPFMLLDEPMESLDPPNRRLVASVLTGADRPVDQMIVTTYEEPLVRRLHAAMPDIKIHVLQ